MAIVAGEPTSSSSASTCSGLARAVRKRLAQHRRAARRPRPTGATARSWISRQVARGAGAALLQQLLHEASLEVTARTAKRTLRSSRIARRRLDAHDRRARPGQICWIDLASTDAAGATEFYCELFGWTATEPIENAGGYRMLLHDGRQVAGLAPVWGDTDASWWSTYVASADADETCAAAIASGGEVVMDAMDVLDAGRMAVLRDPGGAQVSVWQAGQHHGYEAHGEPGTPIWSELMTRDIAAAREFYGPVFGWTSQEEEFDGVRTRSGSAASSWSAARSRWTRAGPRRPSRTGWSTSRRPTATATARRCASSAARSGTSPTTSAPAAARCWRIPAGRSFSVITLRAAG